MNEQLSAHLNSDGPKKILSLDGGGIRGILTLGMLSKIEKELKQKHNASIVDYFDLICGTSTGAIIASGLAIGKSVDEMTNLYLSLGGEIFEKGRKYKLFRRSWKTFRAIFKENYSSENFESFLKNAFGDITIGDTKNIKCGLAINTKRADTYSLWTVANHPDGIYYEANSNLKLWELCRASSAAPYYFKPKVLNLRSRLRPDGTRAYFDAAFIDGGVSLSNNPAWTSFLISTVNSFGFNWKTGSENLFITSLGTGNGLKKENPSEIEKMKALSWAPKLSDLFMTDALEMNQILLEGLGKNLGHGYFIDSQFYPPPNFGPQLFSFDRHNVMLTKEFLNSEKMGFKFSDEEINGLTEMDYSENMQALLKVGEKYAENSNFYLL